MSRVRGSLVFAFRPPLERRTADRRRVSVRVHPPKVTGGEVIIEKTNGLVRV